MHAQCAFYLDDKTARRLMKTRDLVGAAGERSGWHGKCNAAVERKKGLL
jgi:hypothetical protein